MYYSTHLCPAWKIHFLVQNSYYGNASNISSRDGKIYFSGIFDLTYEISSDEEKEEGTAFLPEAPLTEIIKSMCAS